MSRDYAGIEDEDDLWHCRIADSLGVGDFTWAGGFGSALIGIGDRADGAAIAVYDYDVALTIIMRDIGVDLHAATQLLDEIINTGWTGPSTPMFIRRMRSDSLS